MMSEKTVQTTNPLEQYVLLAKSTKGAAAISLIKQVLEASGVYVFGELLDMPNILELSNGPNASYFNLLNLFAFGTYSDYLANKGTLPELSSQMITKLRHLTIVYLATKSKCIPYSVLLQELDLRNLRELEDLIIEVIYADIIRGKLDQKNHQLEVDYAIGRDSRPEHISTIISVLQDWCDGCEAILYNIETQINRANTLKESNNKMRAQVEQEVNNIKKTLKSQTHDLDDQIPTESRETQNQQDKPSKKNAKSKGLRSSGKFWQKST